LSEPLPTPADWNLRLAFARENGLQSAAFHPDGSLAAFTLAADAPERAPAPTPETMEERESRIRRERARIDRTLLGSVSRLVPRGPIE
jgi:hypothetical protein